MSKQAWRYQTLAENTAKINKFCKQYGLHIQPLNNGYQLRIEGVLDLYPVRARYHNLVTHERGGWEQMEDLRKIMLDALPQFDKVITYNRDMVKRAEPVGYVGQLYGVKTVNYPRWWQRLWAAYKRYRGVR